VDQLEEGFVLTPEGYELMRQELHEILTVKRPEVADRIREARQLGDPTENFDYEDAKRAQALLEARMKELKAILAHAKVVEPNLKDGSIGIGSKVVVKDLDEGSEDAFVIVGPAESSPSEGRISHESCVGSQLLGKKTGEDVSIQTPGGIVRFRIVSVG
jgi:transcription elongation factor GreA